MTTPPPYLQPLRRSDLSLSAAFETSVAVFREQPVPSGLCGQCFSEDMQQRIIAAARRVRAGHPPGEGYSSVFFEHANCVGGENAIKLFAPYGLYDFLVQPKSWRRRPIWNGDVVEAIGRAGFWFWSDQEIACLREVALCLFWDWFEHGQYAWRLPDGTPNNGIWPGLDILQFCSLCLIDPYDLVRTLIALETVRSDFVLSAPPDFTVEPFIYVARDTHEDIKAYHDASTAISKTLATRAAIAFETFVSPDWLDQAFYRNEKRAPNVARKLSDLGRDYNLRTLETLETALDPVLEDWPRLDRIE